MKPLQTSPPASRIRRWLPVALLFLVLSLLALVLCQKALVAEPKGEVLLYEVAPDARPKDQKVNMDLLVRAIDRRLNPGWFRRAQVRKTDKQQIEIILLEGSKLDKKQVERLLSCVGCLEFRILANKRDNKNLIEQALADPSKTVIVDEDGKRKAWWVPVKDEETNSIAAYSDIAVRTRKRADNTITEVLLVPDEFNVTGNYLSRVAVDSDEKGRPCIEFALNKTGATLFAELTGSHLPDEAEHFSYKLGVIMDGTLYSAPSLQSTICDRGIITGTFTKKQCDELVRILRAGSLPARIRPVKKPTN